MLSLDSLSSHLNSLHQHLLVQGLSDAGHVKAARTHLVPETKAVVLQPICTQMSETYTELDFYLKFLILNTANVKGHSVREDQASRS